jgi:hypothetical protein
MSVTGLRHDEAGAYNRPIMAEASPARLYATLVGAILVLAGIVGFFYSASFGSPGQVDDALGAFAVNGWVNSLHIFTGAVGLLAASLAPRAFAKWIGLAYLAIAAWGFIAGDGGTLLGVFPVNAESNVLHLALGGLGLAAARATPIPGGRVVAKRRPSGVKRPLGG